MSASQDYVALDWIKDEIGATLKQAQNALEAVAESPSDSSSMRSCLTAIHQVHGTLRMVELKGPTQVAEEMELLAQSLMNQSVDDIERAQEILMQAILQVPTYLERIQRNQSDDPRDLLPIVNNLRLVRGEDVLAGDGEPAVEVDRFAHLSAVSPELAAEFTRRSGQPNVVKLRQRYRQSLHEVLKKTRTRDNLNLIAKVFNTLTRLCGESATGVLAAAGLALIEGIVNGSLRFDVRVVRWLRDADRSLALVGQNGANALGAAVAVAQIEVALELLRGIEHPTARMQALLDQFPDSQSDEEVRPPSLGADADTIGALVAVILEELREVTEKLDLFVRSSAKDLGDLAALVPSLEQVSNTMLVVGMNDHRATIEAQIQALRGIDAGGVAPDDDTLIDIAGAFLRVVAVLAPLSADSEDVESDTFGDLDEAQAAVIREVRNGLAQCKDSVIEFISSNWDRSRLDDLPGALESLRGSLTIVNQARCGAVLSACAGYVKRRLLGSDAVPRLDEMDDLADAITSVDYYFERLLESANDPYLQMIDVAESAVVRLQEAELSLMDAGGPHADLADTEVEIPVAPGSAEIETSVEAAAGSQADEAVVISPTIFDSDEAAQEVLDQQAVRASGTFTDPALSDAASEMVADTTRDAAEAAADASIEPLIDDEIMEIFVEEAEEVMSSLRERFPVWRDRGDAEAMVDVRRAFHTLKGSGRMVGAHVVGELAWSIENMLNEVLEGALETGAGMFELVAETLERVPGCVQDFSD